MSSTRVPYDNNNGQLYDGYDGYDVEKNALITEEQLNRTEKDIRDYLEKIKQELTEYMDKLKYVSYSYNQNLSTVEQSTAQANIDFPGRIQGLTKYYFDTYYQDALTKVMNNLNLVNGIEENLVAGNARIYYLTEEAEKMQYGIPIFAEYFADITPQDLFYHVDNYNNSDIRDELTGQTIPHFTSNSEQENHIYKFVNYLQTVGNNKAGLDNDESDGIRGYIELNPRPNLSYFCPEVLSKIKAGDILYCPTNKNTYIVTEGKSFPGVYTWYNSDGKSLLQEDKNEQNEIFKSLYSFISINSVKETFKGANWLADNNPTYKRIQNTCIYYTTAVKGEYQGNYEHGCLAISCVQTSSLVLQPSLWEYNGSTLFGIGEEYPNSFTKLFGTNNFIIRPVIGDIIYNPLSQEYRRVVRDLTKSERFLSRETYLTEPIIQYTNGELDNTLRALATYGRGTGLFAIPKEYDICLTDTEIRSGESDKGRFRNNFARLVSRSNVNTTGESYESTDDTSTTSEVGRRQALSAIIYDHNTGEIYPAKPNENNQNYTEPYKCPRILFNTYFMIPGILQEAETTNFGRVHPLRLGIVHPGDIIQYNEHSYQVTTQPYLRVFTFAEAKKYLMDRNYIILNNNEEEYNSDSGSINYTLLGDLLFTLFQNINHSQVPTSEIVTTIDSNDQTETKAYYLTEGFKYYTEKRIYYCNGGYYTFENIDQWLIDHGDASELVQAYALNCYNNGTILDYLDNLYHRLFTNLDRPIVVEAIPLGNNSCFGHGDSAYQVYYNTTTDNPKKSIIEWLASLQGDSAYDIAVNKGYSGSEQAWLASLQGDSAYDIAVNKGYSGSEQAWLASLKGEDGARGTDGIGIANIIATREDGSNSVKIKLIYGEDENSETSFTLYDGDKGDSGRPGLDGAGMYKLVVDNYNFTDSSQKQYSQPVLCKIIKTGTEKITSFDEIGINPQNTDIPVVYYQNNNDLRAYYFVEKSNNDITFLYPIITATGGKTITLKATKNNTTYSDNRPDYILVYNNIPLNPVETSSDQTS